MPISISGFLASKRALSKIKRRDTKLFIPTCILFRRDFEEILRLRREGFNVAPLITADEVELLIPCRLEYIYALARTDLDSICVVFPDIESLNMYRKIIRRVSKIVKVFAIVLTLRDVEYSSRQILEVTGVTGNVDNATVFLPLSDEAISIASRGCKVGLVLSLRLYSRSGRAVRPISFDVVQYKIFQVKSICRGLPVLIDILDIGSRRAYL